MKSAKFLGAYRNTGNRKISNPKRGQFQVWKIVFFYKVFFSKPYLYRKKMNFQTKKAWFPIGLGKLSISNQKSFTSLPNDSEWFNLGKTPFPFLRYNVLFFKFLCLSKILLVWWIKISYPKSLVFWGGNQLFKKWCTWRFYPLQKFLITLEKYTNFQAKKVFFQPKISILKNCFFHIECKRLFQIPINMEKTNFQPKKCSFPLGLEKLTILYLGFFFQGIGLYYKTYR